MKTAGEAVLLGLATALMEALTAVVVHGVAASILTSVWIVLGLILLFLGLPTVWQLRHPRQAWWSAHTGALHVAAEAMQIAEEDAKLHAAIAEAKRIRLQQQRQQRRDAAQAEAQARYGDRGHVYECPICGEYVIDGPLTPDRPGGFIASEGPPSYYHIRSHGCTCGPGVSGVCPYCRAGQAIGGWLLFDERLFQNNPSPQPPARAGSPIVLVPDHTWDYLPGGTQRALDGYLYGRDRVFMRGVTGDMAEVDCGGGAFVVPLAWCHPEAVYRDRVPPPMGTQIWVAAAHGNGLETGRVESETSRGVVIRRVDGSVREVPWPAVLGAADEIGGAP